MTSSCKFILVTCILLCLPQAAITQEKFTLSGTVTSAESGEPLTGVSVYDSERTSGAMTNPSGFYSLTLPAGAYKILYAFVGYEKCENDIDLNENITLNIKLSPSNVEIDEVVVKSKRVEEDHNVTSTEVSVEKLNIEQLEKIPVIMGETDIMKTIQLLPGITSVAEGRSGFIVRGSGIDQNLILMDGMPLYYSSHMQGLYSVFNSDAVDELTVYKGGIPARFGGRGASVLDVRMKEGNFDQYRAKLSLGLITSKFSVEAPVIKDKLSVFLAGRSTKTSFGNLYDESKNDGSSGGKGGGGKYGASGGSPFRFFDPYESWSDLNGKVIYKINDYNSLYLSVYAGRDSALVAGGLTEWGNRAASLRWNHLFNDKMLSNTSLIYSRYYTKQTGGIYRFHSGIETTSFKQDFSYSPNDTNDIRFGLSSEFQDYNHGSLEDTTQDDAGKFMPVMQSLESALYAENDWKINSRLSAWYGLRYSLFHRIGPGDSFDYDEVTNEPYDSEHFSGKTDIMAFYHNLEPRLALTWLLNEQSSVKVSYNRNAQYLRLMTLGSEIQWYDIWMPSTENIVPMVTDQIALGYFRNFMDNELEFSAESYYKILDGAADFEDGLHNYLVENLEAYVATGKGRSYGFEVSLEKPAGRFTGRLSYNMGRSRYKIDAINKGRWYPYMFDKTHSLSMLTSFELLKNLTLSSAFFYSTGRPVTLPEAYYHISGVPFPYWEGRNKYRLPDYHRLDFGVLYEPDFLAIPLMKTGREIRPGIKLSLYNVYNRRNVHTIYYNSGSSGKSGGSTDGSSQYEPYGVSTYGFMPTFELNFEF